MFSGGFALHPGQYSSAVAHTWGTLNLRPATQILSFTIVMGTYVSFMQPTYFLGNFLCLNTISRSPSVLNSVLLQDLYVLFN